MSAAGSSALDMLFWQLTIDANHPPVLARFWAQVLGYRPVPPTEPATATATFDSVATYIG
jgi:hypothetical protein